MSRLALLVLAVWVATGISSGVRAQPVAPTQARLQEVRHPQLGGATVQEVMRHAALAPQIVDYEGTKILSILRGRLMETITVNEAHKRPVLTRLEFLSPDGVAGRLVLDDGVRTWHYEPRLNMAFVGPTMAIPAEAAERLATERYRVRLLGMEEVIGRSTVVMSLWPHAGRRERRLWIDRMTGVTLRSEERDPDEALVATAYFTRISYGLNLPAALFQPRLPAGARVVSQEIPPAGLMPLPAVVERIGFRVSVPSALPGGFALLGGAPIRDGPVLAAHLHYSDGVRALALFVAPSARLGPPGRGDQVPVLGGDARTMVAGAMRLLLWETGGVRMTLVGPLSLGEMVTVARTLGRPGP